MPRYCRNLAQTGHCRFGERCRFDHGTASSSVELRVRAIASFGWEETFADPPAEPAALLQFIDRSLVMPGVGKLLRGGVEAGLRVDLRKFPPGPARNVNKEAGSRSRPFYDRPPVVTLLLATQRVRTNWREFAFVSPRRNLLNMAMKTNFVDVQRLPASPGTCFLGRVRDLAEVQGRQDGGGGASFERSMWAKGMTDDGAQLRTLVEATVGRHRVLVSGEVDVVKAWPVADDPASPLEAACELKTATPNSWKRRKLKTFLQCTLCGVEEVILGLKDKGDPNMVTIQRKDLAGLVTANEQAGALEKLASVLDWIASDVPSDGVVYRVDIKASFDANALKLLDRAAANLLASEKKVEPMPEFVVSSELVDALDVHESAGASAGVDASRKESVGKAAAALCKLVVD